MNAMELAIQEKYHNQNIKASLLRSASIVIGSHLRQLATYNMTDVEDDIEQIYTKLLKLHKGI